MSTLEYLKALSHRASVSNCTGFFLLKLKTNPKNKSKMKKGDSITLQIPTPYGQASIFLTAIAILPNNRYALLGQERILVGQMLNDNKWTLSDPIDLLELKILTTNTAIKLGQSCVVS
jgi:hypothetical protein